jgi:hypothetical protein
MPIVTLTQNQRGLFRREKVPPRGDTEPDLTPAIAFHPTNAPMATNASAGPGGIVNSEEIDTLRSV